MKLKNLITQTESSNKNPRNKVKNQSKDRILGIKDKVEDLDKIINKYEKFKIKLQRTR